MIPDRSRRGPPPALSAAPSRVRAAAAMGLVAVLSIACVPPAAAPSPASRPAYCADAQANALQEISGTPAGPYFVRHPAARSAATVVFLPGGSGSKRNAQRVWDTFLAGAQDVNAFRIVIPLDEALQGSN